NADKAAKNTRTCNVCAIPEDPVFKFDAWDTFRDINDRNISTKIASANFSLTLASLNASNDAYQEFKGTTCTQIVGENPSSWIKSYFNDANTSTISFNVSNAIKETKIAIKWWKDTEAANVTCKDGSEDNSTTSSDNFAVRPKQFNLSATGPYYAGEDFNVIAKAYDENLNNTADYNETQGSSFRIDANETRPECNSGSESFVIATDSFSNGITPSLNTNFSALATYLNINIKEIDGSEYAYIDKDDTIDTLRYIKPHDINITINPYELNITSTDMNASTQANWLYMADVNDMNLSLHVKVQANNKQHEVLKDFNSSCYAQDVSLDFDVNVVNGNSALDMNYSAIRATFISSGATLGDIDKSMLLSASEFVDGVGEASYALNVDRSFEEPIAPFSVSGLGANITSTSVAKVINNNSELNDGSFAFYYGRLLAKDVKVTQDVVNPVRIEVYKRNDLNTSSWKQNSLNWYQNEDHSANNFGTIKAHSIETTSQFTSSSDTSVSASFDTPNAGLINTDIATSHSSSVTRVFHLDIDSWLWYMPKDFAKDYSYVPTNSDCQNHPCFNYTFKVQNSANEINSGSFSGSDFTDKDRGDYIKKGIKVFR
ncbi:MAG: hypothetical protein U9R50_03615, partial [Campylobacterota bacterium]|nr:hypothetical protein [Campylobacterota bacterium]